MTKKKINSITSYNKFTSKNLIRKICNGLIQARNKV